jgi:hypothetical protein
MSWLPLCALCHLVDLVSYLPITQSTGHANLQNIRNHQLIYPIKYWLIANQCHMWSDGWMDGWMDVDVDVDVDVDGCWIGDICIGV